MLSNIKNYKQLNSHERISRMYQHKDADRVPIIDSPWAGTLSRWHLEGMPKSVDWRDFFEVDKMEAVFVNISPRFEEKILEKTDQYTITTSCWGVTMKNFNIPDSTPEFLDFNITGPKEWEMAKKRMTVDRTRIKWKQLN